MKNYRSGLRSIYLVLLASIFSACASPATLTHLKIEASNTQISTPAATRPAFPPMYQPPYLNPLDTPRAYIQDTCQYLRYKWNPWNSEPGTVVMIVGFSEVYRGSGSPTGIEINDLHEMMKQFKEQGFQAINTKQFLGFMERNVKIPPRSVLFVRDGNYPQEDYDKYFSEYWEQWGWTIVNGWVSRDDIPPRYWMENMALERSGFVDHQAMGIQTDTYFTDDSSKVIINRELGNPLEIFFKVFSKTPIAFIWPHGGFGMRPVEAARLLGYQLGFTTNPRGPVMYNWVPQADVVDTARPRLIPEGAIKDPLMTLPRYAPRQAIENMDQVRIIGNEARAYAKANKLAEFNYYKIVCEPTYGPIPSP